MRLIHDPNTALNCERTVSLGCFFLRDSDVSARWRSCSSSSSFLPMNGMNFRIFRFRGPASGPTDRSTIPSCCASEGSRAEPLELLPRPCSSFSLKVFVGSLASCARGGMFPGGPAGNVPAFLVPPKSSISGLFSTDRRWSIGEDIVCAKAPPSSSSECRLGFELKRPNML